MRVLFIDDFEDIAAETAARITRDYGYCTDYETNPEKALAKIESFKPDLVVSDVRMPKINGFELCEMIKSKYPQLPVLLLTCWPYPDSLVKKCGAIGLITKPIYPKKLNKALLESCSNG